MECGIVVFEHMLEAYVNKVKEINDAINSMGFLLKYHMHDAKNDRVIIKPVETNDTFSEKLTTPNNSFPAIL
ncbi:hypothetical protein AN697_17930 [Enterobacter cloacae subsp. cloacae]|nr:hypothetical protein AN697_17930 [Enterobacter cloacae subsp. cloacae]